MCSTKQFMSNATNKEFRINFPFNSDSSYVAYLFECGVCGLQYVGSTYTPFRLRFNNYKVCNRRFIGGGASGVPQAEVFRHFVGEGHRGFFEDVRVTIIDRLNGNGRQRESF